MATLNETAHYSRIAIKYGAIALVVMMVGRFVIGIAGNIYSALFPEAPEPPTVGFGILPPVEFPEFNSDEFSYQLQTSSGYLPSFTDRLEVFPYILERSNLLALERAVDTAASLGFETEPQLLSGNEYLWTIPDAIPARLQLNIVSGQFEIEYDWTKAADFLIEKQLINELSYSERVKDVLQSPGLLPADLTNAPYTVTYLQASGRSYEEAVSLSEADFVQFDFFRSPVADLYPVMTPEVEVGVVQAIVSSNPNRAWLVNLDYNYFPVDYERIETYPLKSIEQAWQELQMGRGFVASVDEGVTMGVIRQVELGYYDAFDGQQFLQPIYIFRGDNRFVAYVQAVRDPTLSPTPAN